MALSSKTSRLSLVVIALAVVLLLAAVACGGSSPDPTPAGSSGSAPAATTAPAASANTGTAGSAPAATAAPAASANTGTAGSAPAATPVQVVSAAPGSTGGVAEPESEPILVVTTSNIAGDWVKNIGGDHVEVFSLLPIGADPHGYQPGARDVAQVADAGLVLSIGLGLEEGWMHELVENAAADPELIVELAEIEAIDPIEFGESHGDEHGDEHADEHGDHHGDEHGDEELLEAISHIIHEVEDGDIEPSAGIEELAELIESVEHDHGHENELVHEVEELLEMVESGGMSAEEALEELEAHVESHEDHEGHEGEEGHEGHGEHEMGGHEGHDHGTHDPHFWFDPLRVQIAVNDIAARLGAIDPANADAYNSNAATYNAQLDELHHWTEEQVAMVPEERRLLVTSHDSLGYFASRYHFEVVGVILGLSTLDEPSAESLAELVHEIEETGAPAIFGETTVSERLAATLAQETGANLVRLYSGSLGERGSGADTYVGMIRANTERIVAALQ